MAEVIGRRFRKYAALKEKGELVKAEQDSVLSRHVSATADFPDLVMIDGGKGQLSLS
jgi:excinuclease ABC subunit C